VTFARPAAIEPARLTEFARFTPAALVDRDIPGAVPCQTGRGNGSAHMASRRVPPLPDCTFPRMRNFPAHRARETQPTLSIGTVARRVQRRAAIPAFLARCVSCW
jgi:hypothetical protein